MITRREYDKKTEREWIGVRVRLLKDTQTRGGITYPCGSSGKIIRKYKGFEIQGDPCPHCGVVLRVKEINPLHVEMITDETEH